MWLSYKIEEAEDQQQFMIPMTRLTENIYYNLRMIIDNKVLTEPRTWRITKINRIAHKGCVLATLAQDKFDQHKDYIELDNDGNVIGMWADYWETSVEPEFPETDHPITYSVISYSGLTPEIKIGGSYKKYNVAFYINDSQIETQSGDWIFTYRTTESDEPIDASDLVDVIIIDESNIKVKFIGGEKYYNGILNVTYTSHNDISSTLEVYVNTL